MSDELQERFDAELETRIKELQSCQQTLGLASCMKCEKIFECELRRAYVDCAYNSMSKGQSGGFDF